jgi:hypothetical protein
MNNPPDICRRRSPRERGNSRFNFLLVVLVIGAAAYVAYRLVPVYYHASLYKDYMTGTVNKGVASGKDVDWIREQLVGKSAAVEYDLPPNAKVETQAVENRMIVRVRWERDIQLPGYTYRYDFDHTVKSDEFLNPK